MTTETTKNLYTALKAFANVVVHYKSIKNVEVLGIGPKADSILNLKENCPIEIENNPIVVETPKYVVLSGLAHDEDADSPEDDEYGASLICRQGSDLEKYYRAVGRDRYGNEDLEAPVVAEMLISEMEKDVLANPTALKLLQKLARDNGYGANFYVVDFLVKTAKSTIFLPKFKEKVEEKFANPLHNSTFTRDEVDTLSFIWERFADDAILEVWKTLKENFLVGNPYAFSVDRYSHGQSCYSLSNEGPQCRWDTASGSHLVIPHDLLVADKQAEVLTALGFKPDTVLTSLSIPDRVKVISAVRAVLEVEMRTWLESYTSYCNGDTHGFLTYVIDRETGAIASGLTMDASTEEWGIIGYEHAEEAQLDDLLATLNNL